MRKWMNAACPISSNDEGNAAENIEEQLAELVESTAMVKVFANHCSILDTSRTADNSDNKKHGLFERSGLQ